MTDNHSGSCLCGTVRFEILGSFERLILCHCEYCRKDTGSAHAANLFSSSAKLNWITGESQVSRFRLGETRHQRAFCSKCGSAMPYAAANGAMIIVPAGSLDTRLELRPEAHIFMASRAAWDDDLQNIPKFERFPG
jgi:hypothetical protein